VPESKQRASLLAIVVVSVGVLLFSVGAMQGITLQEKPVAGPKAVDGLRHLLRINGNSNADEVVFDHEKHREFLGGQSGCPNCHHVYRPRDIFSPCFLCHSDMTQVTPIFNHESHEQELGGNVSCAKCHDLDLPKSRENSKSCHECHAQDMGMQAPREGIRYNYMALGYEDTMHGLCVTCHQEKAGEMGMLELVECDTCHHRVHHEEDEKKR